jgi:hypothetical protein
MAARVSDEAVGAGCAAAHASGEPRCRRLLPQCVGAAELLTASHKRRSSYERARSRSRSMAACRGDKPPRPSRFGRRGQRHPLLARWRSFPDSESLPARHIGNVGADRRPRRLYPEGTRSFARFTRCTSTAALGVTLSSSPRLSNPLSRTPFLRESRRPITRLEIGLAIVTDCRLDGPVD